MNLWKSVSSATVEPEAEMPKFTLPVSYTRSTHNIDDNEMNLDVVAWTPCTNSTQIIIIINKSIQGAHYYP